MTSVTPLSTPADATTRRLLGLGMLAGPVYLVVGFAQAFTRPGFDIARHPLSSLANGDLGWIQTANFLVTAVLVMAGAVGLARSADGRGRFLSAILILVFGLSMVGAALFRADAGAGFPPGSPEVVEISQSGILHFALGGIGFLGFVAGAVIEGLAALRAGRTGWGWTSVVTGAAFLAAFAGIAAGAGSSPTVLAFYAAVVLAFVWLTLLFARRRA